MQAMDPGFLNTTFVEIFLLENPAFLDEFVKIHVSRDRIEKWIHNKPLPGTIHVNALPPLQIDNVPITINNPTINSPIPSFVPPEGLSPVSSVTPKETKKKIKKPVEAIPKESNKCNFCHKVFTCPSKLKRHLPKHTGTREFQCETCGNKFSTLSNLRTHEHLHKGDLPVISCVICGKGFSYKCHLKTHMRIHSGEMPYKCQECGMDFAFKHSLTVHVRIHTKAKPYKCVLCDAAFAQSCNLKKHMVIHTKEKPWRCDECGKDFTQSSNLTKHKKRFHFNKDNGERIANEDESKWEE